METLTPNKWPVDFDKLNKGDIVSREVIERWGGVSANSRLFGLKLLSLKEVIERELINRGKDWTLKICDDNIVILLDAEASKYNYQMTTRRIKGVMKDHYRQLGVDTNLLSNDEKKIHDRRITIQGFLVQGVTWAKKQIGLKVHERTIPQIGGGTIN
jgi:hypothetical protein